MAATVCATALGPPRYLAGYELAWSCLEARPSSFLIPLDTLMIHHGDDFTPVREYQKTYRRLFGMIYFGGSESILILYLQRFATP